MSDRPRDRLGRPLSREDEGFPQVAERQQITADDAIDESLAYLGEGLPFHAHEVLEQRWRCCPDDERDLWRALAAWAAAATQDARGNSIGAASLSASARESLQRFAGPRPPRVADLLAALAALTSGS